MHMEAKSDSFWEASFSKPDSRPAEPQDIDGTDREWIASVEDVIAAVHGHIPQGGKLLVVGCGESQLSAGLLQEGWTDITSTDISPAAISCQRARHPGIAWMVDDCTSMKFQGQNFDCVIDKGTADAMLFRSKSHERCSRVCGMFREVCRVLKNGGVYICVSPRKKVPWMQHGPEGSEWHNAWKWSVKTSRVKTKVPPSAERNGSEPAILLMSGGGRKKETVPA